MKRLMLLLLMFPCLGTQAHTYRLDTVIHRNINIDTAIFRYNLYENIEIVSYVSNLKKNHNKWNSSKYDMFSYYTIIDGVQCDSSYVITSLPAIYDDVAYYQNGFNNNRRVFVTKDKQTGICIANYQYSYCSLLPFRIEKTTISIINPATNQSVKDIKFDKYLWKGEYISTTKYDDFHINDTYTYVLSMSKCLTFIDDGDPNGSSFFQLIDDNGNIKEIGSNTIIHVLCADESYLETKCWDFHIRDYDMNIIGTALERKFSKYGANISEGRIFCYYVSSTLNDADYNVQPIKYGTEVIIPYKFNPQLEIQMYRAYNDTLLSEADIEGLGKYELGILRNLLFAKHNYAFKSEFYQAYFNMYEFYNSQKMRTTRKANVDNELTANDKANIALIRKMEAKLK